MDKELEDLNVRVKKVQEAVAEEGNRMGALKQCTKDVSRKSASIRQRTQKNDDTPGGKFVEPKNGDNFISLPSPHTHTHTRTRRTSFLNLEEKAKSDNWAQGGDDQTKGGSMGRKKGVRAKFRSFSSRTQEEEITHDDHRRQVWL